MVFFIKSAFGKQYIDCEDLYISGDKLKTKVADRFGIPSEHFLLYCHDRIIHEKDTVKNGNVVHALFRLPGGKGGFGSMLRAIGAQIEKTTNKEACRDLSGRRLRDINEEKRLKKWIAKQAEREVEEAEKKKLKLERLKSRPKHEFQDPNYDKHRSNLMVSINDALAQGLQKEKTNKEIKRPCTVTSATVTKKPRLWIRMEEEEIDSEEISDEEANIPSTSQSSNEEFSNQSVPLQCQQEEEATDKQSIDKIACDSSGSTSEDPDVSSVKCESSASVSDSPNSYETDPHIENKQSSTTVSQASDTWNSKGSKEINLEEFSSVEELEKIGLENLKDVLMSLNMKCGGTLRQRAERLLSVKGLKKEDIPPSFLAKSSKK